MVASVKDLNGCLDKESSQQHIVKESTDISYQIQSLTTFGDENHLRDIPVLPPGLDECGWKDSRTYLVAGGIGGFGFEVTFWMAENGAKSIGILGRSKPSDAKRQELRQIERRTGAKIHIFPVR